MLKSKVGLLLKCISFKGSSCRGGGGGGPLVTIKQHFNEKQFFLRAFLKVK